MSNIVGEAEGEAEQVQMNSRVIVNLAHVKKCHKCKFVPRLLSIIVGDSTGSEDDEEFVEVLTL